VREELHQVHLIRNVRHPLVIPFTMTPTQGEGEQYMTFPAFSITSLGPIRFPPNHRQEHFRPGIVSLFI
jgi:hypothetical protein